jgi:tRNA-Thr(GGU) m(6)t(6)A37 methyltransferase TsaA
MDHITIEPIGIIETPFDDLADMPIQPLSGLGIKGRIIIDEAFVEGLKDIDGFSHIILIYYLHSVSDYSLKVIPFMDIEEHGIFATRSPKRPNKIGLSTVKLLSVNRNILEIEDLDIVNGTPLLDIKPYFAAFDYRENAKSGWLGKRENLEIEKYSLRSDNRFL